MTKYRSSSSIKQVFETLEKEDVNNRVPNLTDIAKLIKSGSVNNIIIMAGAGISTRAGIPDFRSPETGIYANLEKFKLPYPEAIFDIEFFKENPIPFYTLAEEINPKKYKPTKTHEFFKLLEKKRKLKRCYTQNIDTLERLTGLSEDLIVEAHGSFATCHCLECHAEVSDDEFMQRLHQNPVPLVRCWQKSCLGKPTALIKPDIVFFGEQLPRKFYESLSDFSEADLLIVLGTSLQVEPFASLIKRVPINCPRLLINLEVVGEMKQNKNPDGFDFKGIQRGGKKFIRDVLFLGTTDDGIEQLCDLLGWKDELLGLYHRNQNIKTDETRQEDIGEMNREGQEKMLDPEKPGEKPVDNNSIEPKISKVDNKDKAAVEEKINTSSQERSLDHPTAQDGNHVQPASGSQDAAILIQDEQLDQLTSIIDDLSLFKKN